MIIHNKKAFTLIEVLVCILLLAIILAGGISLYFNGTKIMTLAMHKKIAMEVVNQAMEQVRKDGYTNLSYSNSVNNNIRTCGSSSPVTFGDFSVQKQQCLTNIEGNSPNKNKEIEIIVNWSETGSSESKIIALATYISPPLP